MQLIKKACLVLMCLMAFNAISQTFRVGSFNLRYDNPNDSLNNWKYRENTVAKLIQFHDFDIFGSQEGLKNMLNQLNKDLPEYAYIGVGRDDGKQEGEHSAIFYKKDKFELLDKGDFWLAEDITKPQKGWDAVLPRICSWGKFRDKASNLVFYLFNTHFDHVGTIARSESAKLILKEIHKIAGDKPTVLTGDFNVDQNSASYKVLNTSRELIDAYDIAKLKYGAEGSFNGFKVNSNTQSRIDHIFVTDDFTVLKHGILTDTYHIGKGDILEKTDSGNFPKEVSLYTQQARLPSDHYPLLAIIKFNQK